MAMNLAGKIIGLTDPSTLQTQVYGHPIEIVLRALDIAGVWDVEFTSNGASAPVDTSVIWYEDPVDPSAGPGAVYIYDENASAWTAASFDLFADLLAANVNIVNDISPQLGGTLDTNGKQVRWSKGADVASANALTLGVDGNSFDITGTTTITSIGPLGVGSVVLLQFDAALTLTHHATDLILPGGANITTAAGDSGVFWEYDSGSWQCISYTRASVAPVATGNIAVSGRLAAHTDLKIANNGSNPTYQLDVSADAVDLYDTSGNRYTATSVSETFDISLGAAENGLDAGTEATSTDYYIWLFSNGSDVQVRGSTSMTAPTVPSGYNYKGLVGCIHNDSGGDFISMIQRNHVVAVEDDTILNGGTATSATALSLTHAPAGITKATGYLGAANTTVNARGIVIGPESTLTIGASNLNRNEATSGYIDYMQFSSLVYTDQTLYYKMSGANSTGYIILTGYEW